LPSRDEEKAFGLAKYHSVLFDGVLAIRATANNPSNHRIKTRNNRSSHGRGTPSDQGFPVQANHRRRIRGTTLQSYSSTLASRWPGHKFFTSALDLRGKRQFWKPWARAVPYLDYDNDGWLDIYLLNGSTVAAKKVRSRNRGPCSFTTITMVRSLTLPKRLALRTSAGDSVWPSATMTTTAGRTYYVANYGKNRTLSQ